MSTSPVNNVLLDDSDAVQPSFAPVEATLAPSTAHTATVNTALAVEKTTADIRMLSAVTTTVTVNPSNVTPATPAAPPVVAPAASRRYVGAGFGDSAGAVAAAPAGAGAGGLPPIDPNDGTLPDWFNADIPDNYLDGYSYFGTNDIVTKLMNMISYMASVHDNKTAPQVFLLYVSNLENSGLLQKYPALNAALTSKGIFAGTGAGKVSIINMAIDVMIDQNYFSSGDPQFAFFKSLFPGNDALCQDVQSHLAVREQYWSSWVASNQHKDPTTGKMVNNFTSDQFNVIASGLWANDLALAKHSVQSWQSMMRLHIADTIINSGSGAALALLICLIFGSFDADTTNQIAGNGATSHWLSQRITDSKKIVTDWSANNFGANDTGGQNAANFVGELMSLQFMADNSGSAAGGLAGQVDSGVGTILNQPTTIKGSDGNFLTVAQLYNQDAASGNYTDLTNELAKFQPVAGVSPPQWGPINDAVKGLVSTFTDQSQITSAALSQLTGTASSLDGVWSKALTDPSTGYGALMMSIIGQFSKN